MMKYLLGFVVLLGGAACQRAAPPTHQQAAITAYVVRTIADPDSYRPQWWGRPRLVRWADKTRADQAQARQGYGRAWRETQQAFAAYTRLAATQRAARPVLDAATARAYHHYRRCLHRSDSLDDAARQLTSRRDTARFGYLIAHGYTARRASGSPFRDSAVFLVDESANVVVWNPTTQK